MGLYTEFLAENELVEIVSNSNISRVDLLTGSYGPFQPLERHKVPLWLAILFKNKHKCKIILPDFLDQGSNVAL
jgi:GINS complex subunit 2